MERKVFIPNGVCAKEISFDYEDGKIYNLTFARGCQGNLLAISKLLEGKSLVEVKTLLQGNTCGARPTSCTDQLAIAISEVL